MSVGAAAAATGAAVRVAPITRDLAPTWEQIEPLTGPRTAAVILAHMRGMPAPDTARIAAMLIECGIPLIEDCAQAWGVRAGDRPAGGYGTVSVFSTQAHKLVATGEGGIVLTDDPEIAAAVAVNLGPHDPRHRHGPADIHPGLDHTRILPLFQRNGDLVRVAASGNTLLTIWQGRR